MLGEKGTKHYTVSDPLFHALYLKFLLLVPYVSLYVLTLKALLKLHRCAGLPNEL